MEQIAETAPPRHSARRGRPPSGRKTVAQVPLEPEDHDAVRAYSEREGRPVADVLRDLIKGQLKWKDIVR